GREDDLFVLRDRLEKHRDVLGPDACRDRRHAVVAGLHYRHAITRSLDDDDARETGAAARGVVGVVEQIVLDEGTDARVRFATDQGLLEFGLGPRSALEVRRLDLVFEEDPRGRV